MSNYIYPIEVGEPTEELDDLYEEVLADEDLLAYLEIAERMSEPEMVALVEEFGIEAVNSMCWIIKAGKFDFIKPEQNDEQY